MYRRIAFAVALALCALGATGEPAKLSAPLVPFVPTFNHFDHHWFEWMPKNPKYEAIEAMVSDNPGGPPDILVFMTERKAPKRQLFFTNNRMTAASGFAAYRDIAYSRSGDPGDAQGMHIRLRGQNNEEIDWSIAFHTGAKARASQGGLTGQSGHSGSTLFMLFYREKGAQTTENRLRIGAADYSLTRSQIGTLPFGPSYSANIFVGTLPYATSRITWHNQALSINGLAFKRAPEAHAVVDYVAQPYPGSSTTLRYDGANLAGITSENNGHTFVTRISPGLRPDGGDAAFSVSFDNFENVMTGTVHAASTKRGTALDWKIATSWAKGRHLHSLLTSNQDGYLLTFGQ